MNVLRGLQTAESLIKNQERNCHQGGGISQGRQNSGAVIAICCSRAGRTRLQINGKERQQQCEKIRQIVAGFGEQGQGMGTNTGNNQENNVGQSYKKRDSQNPRSPLAWAVANMRVHLLSLRG